MEFLANIFLFILIIILDIGGVIQIIRAKKADKELPKDVLSFDLEYFREVINKEATIGDLGFIYNSPEGFYYLGEHFVELGILLNIALKEWIEIIKSNDDTLKIYIKDKGKEELQFDEKIIYEYISKIPKEKEYITIKEYWEYQTENKQLHRDILNELREKLKQRAVENGKYKEGKDKERRKYVVYSIINIGIIYLILVLNGLTINGSVTIINLINSISFLIMAIIYMIATIFINKVSKVSTNFTKKGLEEYELLDGLKNYIKEYTTIPKQGIECLG